MTPLAYILYELITEEKEENLLNKRQLNRSLSLLVFEYNAFRRTCET
jgi:hypothetical protein